MQTDSPKIHQLIKLCGATLTYHLVVLLTGWPQSRRKKIPSIPAFFRAINLLFHRLSQQKVNVIMTFIKGHDDLVYQVNSCFTQVFEWWTKNTLFVTIFPWGCTEFTEFPSFPCSQKSLSIPGFPDMWPPCLIMAGDAVQVILEAGGLTKFAGSTTHHLLISGDEPSHMDTRGFTLRCSLTTC